MYLADAMRSNISFVVSKLSRFTSNSRGDHWLVLGHLMNNLVGTIDYGIHYYVYPIVLEQYSDANWITNCMRCIPQAGMFSLLEVLLFHADHTNRPC
jgi:hypothetical protein